MTGGNGPAQPAARQGRGPWPTPLRLLDQALADGLLSRAWLEEVLGDDPWEDAIKGFGRLLGHDLGRGGRRLPREEVERQVELLLDGATRHEVLERYAVFQAAGSAALYVLARQDDRESLPTILVEGIAGGQVTIPGALGLLGRCARGNEVLARRWMDELLRGLSDRSLGLLSRGEETEEEPPDGDGDDAA